MRLKLIPKGLRPAVLDLPWHLPLEAWRCDCLVEPARGIHRHVVRFVSVEDVLCGLKELPEPAARREYDVLRRMAQRDVPAVEAVGVISDRDGLDSVLVTRYLEYSLPFRHVLAQPVLPDWRVRLVDALAELLVRLHLTGFFWGDCSLSNTLFRRDAGALAAYLVDAETAEWHPILSDGQRRHDLELAEENIAGELLDLDQELGRDSGDDPFAVAAAVRAHYEQLWDELTREETYPPGEHRRLEQRLARLNALGFDVGEVELVAVDDGMRLSLSSHVVEPGHHRRRLLRLTGLDAQENQARRLLDDVGAFRCELERRGLAVLSENALAARWLHEVFEPAMAAIPPALRAKRAAAELYHELLVHRWYLAQAAGAPVPMREAVASYVREVLPTVADEREPVALEPPAA